MRFTATITISFEVPLEAESEDAAWEEAEGELVSKVESLDEHLPPGTSVYRCQVDEVEAG
ncbi:MAG TPA: hypothetical protein VLA89_06130 [Gemmatimonadales bacterium]|nr:hypothetical protein [Gemmatimonadales bacterium]